MIKKRLGVNIDHVATIRNARGEIYPDPVRVALYAQRSGADSITIHLREDRRHIRDSDLKNIKKKLRIPLNLEMAPTKEMLKIFDISDNLMYNNKENYTLLHLKERVRLYNEQDFQYEIVQIKLKR